MAIILKRKPKDLTESHRVVCLPQQCSLYVYSNFIASAALASLLFNTPSLLFHQLGPSSSICQYISLPYFILLFMCNFLRMFFSCLAYLDDSLSSMLLYILLMLQLIVLSLTLSQRYLLAYVLSLFHIGIQTPQD